MDREAKECIENLIWAVEEVIQDMAQDPPRWNAEAHLKLAKKYMHKVKDGDGNG